MQAAGVLTVFESSERAEDVVNGLCRAGYDGARLSVIGKDEHPIWTRLGRALRGAALISMPLVGYAVALGPIATRLDANSSLVAVLMRAGMSAGASATYEAAVRGGQIVVLVHGTAKDVIKARRVLRELQKSVHLQ